MSFVVGFPSIFPLCNSLSFLSDLSSLSQIFFCLLSSYIGLVWSVPASLMVFLQSVFSPSEKAPFRPPNGLSRIIIHLCWPDPCYGIFYLLIFSSPLGFLSHHVQSRSPHGPFSLRFPSILPHSSPPSDGQRTGSRLCVPHDVRH